MSVQNPSAIERFPREPSAARPAGRPERPEPRFPGRPETGPVLLNHIQIRGTHNSYHQKPRLKLAEWNYAHPGLQLQLEQMGIRQIELDIHWDFNSKSFRVYHVPFLDARSSCRHLRRCLAIIQKWSDSRRDHLPLFIFLQPKSITRMLPNAKLFRRIEREVLAEWPRSRMVTPDQVQGSHPTLAEAIRRSGWPALSSVRGKALFVLMISGPKRRGYSHGGKHLKGRLMFVTSRPDTPYAAVVNIDDPVAGFNEIRAAVRAQMIVRTRADANLKEAEEGDLARFRAARSSGAHIIVTDFPARAKRRGYVVSFPGGAVALCNPVTSPKSCKDSDLGRR